ncbi:formyltransferase family protein [Gaetbulibacter sp. M240]|uniref:formyltransferase family protein n=1 Tax=Gaetbulibacter sp. M240 TaxID=3126511 RepID=UPI00374F4AC3
MTLKKDKKLRWAILTTGLGRNACDTIKNVSEGKVKDSEIACLIYESEPCVAKDMAIEKGIEAIKIKKGDFTDTNSYYDYLLSKLKYFNVDYILLLSYEYIIRQKILNAFRNRIINIHPSLFPSFLRTRTAIQEALEYGVKVTGITTHIIDDQVDEGEILCQKAIKVKAHDTFETLYPRFSRHGEKIILKTIKVIENRHFGH